MFVPPASASGLAVTGTRSTSPKRSWKPGDSRLSRHCSRWNHRTEQTPPLGGVFICRESEQFQLDRLLIRIDLQNTERPDLAGPWSLYLRSNRTSAGSGGAR